MGQTYSRCIPRQGLLTPAEPQLEVLHSLAVTRAILFCSVIQWHEVCCNTSTNVSRCVVWIQFVVRNYSVNKFSQLTSRRYEINNVYVSLSPGWVTKSQLSQQSSLCKQVIWDSTGDFSLYLLFYVNNNVKQFHLTDSITCVHGKHPYLVADITLDHRTLSHLIR